MALWNMIALMIAEGRIEALPIAMPYIVDTLITATVTITALVLAMNVTY